MESRMGADREEVSPLIDAGQVELGEDWPSQAAKHKAATATSTAHRLVWVLAGGLILHYSFVWLLTDNAAALETLGSAFNAWLPVVASLLSAAATYYFSRERG